MIAFFAQKDGCERLAKLAARSHHLVTPRPHESDGRVACQRSHAFSVVGVVCVTTTTQRIAAVVA